MKTVFNNSMTAHVWFSQSQDYGNNSNSSLYFSGATIFSYGSHYPLATIYKDQEVVLVNSTPSSVTTGQHRSDVLRAIDNETFKTISVPDTMDAQNRENIEHLESRVLETLENLFKGRMHHESHYIYSIGKYNDYLDYFGPFVGHEKIEIDDHLESFSTEVAKKRRIRESKEAEKRKIIQAKQLQEFRVGETSSVNSHKIYLRVRNGLVETSHGADVPLKDALRLYKALKNKTVNIGHIVGSFTLEKHSDDIVKIGCHVIELSEADLVLGPILALINGDISPNEVAQEAFELGMELDTMSVVAISDLGSV
jgi:hypothetical protein